MLNEDYKEMLQILLDNKAKFLIVGAYSMGAYGYPRATGDIGIWVESSPENSKKIYQSLATFGAPLAQMSEETFSEKGIIFQIGVAPRRIDIITHIDGVNFQEAFASKEIVEIDGLKIPFISRKDLIKNKRATGREKDRIDANLLEEVD